MQEKMLIKLHKNIHGIHVMLSTFFTDNYEVLHLDHDHIKRNVVQSRSPI
jgi:hypothetical protein